MIEQDLDEDEICTYAVPFSTLPSLVQLQQMRNKLSVAYLSRELMKWNSSSTGIELKKLSADLQIVYRNFANDMREAFLLLARCRYFNHDFYKTTTEDVKLASINVLSSLTNVAGVNMITYTMMVPNNNVRKCPVLSRGGQAIQEAKRAWSNLLFSHIKMVELRTNFLSIEAAYRTATKRQNIINQIVLPKTQATIKYILVELEETSREETHRMKVKLSKIRNLRKGSTSDNEMCIKEGGDGIKDEILIKDNEINLLNKDRSEFMNEQTLPYSESEFNKEYFSPVKPKTQQVIHSLRKFYELVYLSSNIKKDIAEKKLSLGDYDSRSELNMIDKATIAMEDFLEVGKDARNQLYNLLNNEKLWQVDGTLENFDYLKGHIDAIISTNSKIINSSILAPSLKHFIRSCERIYLELKITTMAMEMPLSESGKKRIYNLIRNIDDVVKTVSNYKDEGLLTPSIEEFTKICNEAKAKIGVRVRSPCPKLQKIKNLKIMLSDVENLTIDISGEDVISPSTEIVLSTCKGFKLEQEEHKRNVPISEQIDELESVQKCMMSCEDFIKHTKNLSSNIYNDNNIVKVSELMVNWQRQGLINKSTIEYLATHGKSRWVIDFDNDSHASSSGHFIMSPRERESNRSLFIYDKTRAKRSHTNSSNHFIFPPIHVCPLQSENCELFNEIYNSNSPHAKFLNKSNVSSREVKKSLKKDVDNLSIPMQSDCIEGLDGVTQLPSGLKEAEICTKSGKCFSKETSVSLFTENTMKEQKDKSEIIVAEITAYDSCPVFETKDSDVWNLEKCYEKLTESVDITKTYVLASPSQTSEESVDGQKRYVCAIKNSPGELTVKKTFTM